MPTQPERKSQADYDEEAGGYNEASEAYNLGLTDTPPPKPKAPPPKPKTTDKPEKKMAKGGMVRRGDGCCIKGKTKGRMV